ncbi:something about silencing protein 10 [Chanos chanos]|uniref:Something about silencing protein 10 n=1 Tax=Chanos chanos TaxID=29144 RepID=A0A6J2VN17_CHACN|nr:something about silencing protein 10 [Chanos chanos]
MVRARRVVRKPKVKKVEEYDSDDPAAYKDEQVPDKKSSKYVEDKIDEFHNKKISNLLARGVQEDSDAEEYAEEEEVMPLTVNDSEEDDDDDEEEEEEDEVEGENRDMDSDLEGKRDDDLPDDMAWGHKKRMFYDSDYVAAKGKSLEEAEAEDKEEEEEAKNIQKRLAANLSEEDYDLSLLQEFAVEEEESKKTVEKEERIVKDLNKMSQKEKLKLLKKESPELLELIQDFKAKLTELRDEIQPLVEMVSNGRILPGKVANYLINKQQLYLNYCTNISFYLVLKAKRIPAHSHPVIERLVAYRNLINELSVVDTRLAPQLRQLLSGDEQEKMSKKPESSKKISKTQESEMAESEESESDLDEEAALLFYKGVEERLKLKRNRKELQTEEELMEEEEEELDGETKRGITYQMAKNKGLTPKRKKIDRNPRVKHREKYRRAKIRRKGQVQEVRREETRYSGELSGIRAGVKKSIKLK